jgi:hypothetical protein
MRKLRGLNGHIELAMGRLWDIEKDRIQIPYRYTMSVVAGQEPRFYGWYPGSDLMQTRLVETLRSAGVDNLQTFPAEIRHKITNEEVPGYFAVNIIGRVSCANLGQSKAEPLIGDEKYIEKLVIDPAKARGALMFRLHESSMIVLVHEQVAQAIKEGGFLGLTLEPIAEASGG